MDAACAWKRTPLQSLRSVYGLRTHDRAAAAFARCFKAIFRICDQKASSLIVKRHGIACRRLVDTVNTILVLLLHLRNHSFQLLRSSSPGPQECTKKTGPGAQAPGALYLLAIAASGAASEVSRRCVPSRQDAVLRVTKTLQRPARQETHWCFCETLFESRIGCVRPLAPV